MLRTVILAVVLTVVLAGCSGNSKSIYREFDTDKGAGALVDIKQRAIIVSRRTSGGEQRTIVCPEPSPDALSAYSEQLAAEGKTEKAAEVRLAAAFQEAAGFVGLRTPSIQLCATSCSISATAS